MKTKALIKRIAARPHGKRAAHLGLCFRIGKKQVFSRHNSYLSNGISEHFNKAVFQKDADRLANIEDPEQSELVLFGMHISQIQFNVPSKVISLVWRRVNQ